VEIANGFDGWRIALYLKSLGDTELNYRVIEREIANLAGLGLVKVTTSDPGIYVLS
jgi:hypothetical protein